MAAKPFSQQKPAQYGIYVGAPSPDTVREARDAILSIISTPVADSVKTRALDALHGLCRADSLNVTNSSFQFGENA